MIVKMNYYLTPAWAIPDKTFFKRIGIIPYFFHNNEKYFFMMLDSKYEEITDCGGIPKTNEKWINTAIRETKEESRNIFNFNREYIMNNGILYWREDCNIAVIFVNITELIKDLDIASSVCYYYRLDYLKGISSKDKRHFLENSDMFYYNIKTISTLLKQKNKIYNPIRMLFSKLIKTKTHQHLP